MVGVDGGVFSIGGVEFAEAGLVEGGVGVDARLPAVFGLVVDAGVDYWVGLLDGKRGWKGGEYLTALEVVPAELRLLVAGYGAVADSICF